MTNYRKVNNDETISLTWGCPDLCFETGFKQVLRHKIFKSFRNMSKSLS